MFTLEESQLLARMLRFVTRLLTACAGGAIVWYFWHHGHRTPLHVSGLPIAFRRRDWY
jgi:hypothetical protein